MKLSLSESYFPTSKNTPPSAVHRIEARSFSSDKQFNTISTPRPLVSLRISCSNEVSLELPMWESKIDIKLKGNWHSQEKLYYTFHKEKVFLYKISFFFRANCCKYFTFKVMCNINSGLAQSTRSSVDQYSLTTMDISPLKKILNYFADGNENQRITTTNA